MKKILLSLFVLLFHFVSAQSTYFNKQGSSHINGFLIGEFNFDSTRFYRTQGFEGQYEYYIKNGISIAAFGNYIKEQEAFDSTVNNEHGSFNAYSVGLITNKQLFYIGDKCFFYGGLRIGFRSISINSNKHRTTEPAENYKGAIYGLQVGGRYWFSEKFALQLEFGSYLAPKISEFSTYTGFGNVGVTYKLQ